MSNRIIWLQSDLVDQFLAAHRSTHLTSRDIREFLSDKAPGALRKVNEDAFSLFISATLLYIIDKWPRKRGRKPKHKAPDDSSGGEDFSLSLERRWKPYRMCFDPDWKVCLTYKDSGKHRAFLAPIFFRQRSNLYCHPTECKGPFEIGVDVADTRTGTAGDYRLEGIKRLLSSGKPTRLSAPLEQLRLLGLATRVGKSWKWEGLKRIPSSKLERGITRRALQKDRQFRRLILTLEFIEGSDHPSMYSTFDYDEPNPKLRQESNNYLCRYGYLNYRSLENFVISFSAYNTVVGYYYKRGMVAGGGLAPNRAEAFLTCHVDSLQNLLSEDNELVKCFQNDMKTEKTKRHREFLGLKPKESFKQALSKIRAKPESLLLEFDTTDCPSKRFVISKVPVNDSLLCDFLDERIDYYRNFVYYPAIRFEASKCFGISLKEFDLAFVSLLNSKWGKARAIDAFWQGVGIQDRSHQISREVTDHFRRQFDTLQIT